MPDMTPVGDLIQPPDPLKGINTFSGLLGIKQRQQEIGLQQQQLQVGQANVQQKQQAMNERLMLQGAMASGKDDRGNTILNDQGEPDPDKLVPFISRTMPLTGQPVIQNILKTQSDKAQLQDSVRQLGQNYKSDMSGIVRSFANNPQATSSDINAALDEYVKRNPKALASAHWASNILGDHFDNVPPAQKNKALLQLAQEFQPAATTAAQQAPAPMPVQAPGNKLNLIETNPLAIGGAGQKLGEAVQGVAPAQQPGYLGQAAAATATGGAAAQNDEALYNQITQGATRVGQMKSLSGEVQQLAQEVKTGKYSKEGAALWTAIAQRIPGFDNTNLTEATRRQLLGKYTQQLMLQAEQANGASTDAAQAHVQAAMPDPDHMTPDAIVDAARYVSGQADVANARAKLAMKYRDLQGNSQGLRSVDTLFMSQADPRSFVYKDLPAGEQRRQYLRDHPDFKNQLMLKLHQESQQQ